MDILREHETALQALPAEQRSKRFGEIAKTESDCSSHSNNGDLGPFSRGQMQKPCVARPRSER
jgi:NIMA-interacting peptidyl-prolyl cis-trans isomerase 1